MRERSSPLLESLGNDRFGQESGRTAFGAAPQEISHLMDVPDAGFCIGGTRGFLPFVGRCKTRELAHGFDRDYCWLSGIR